MDSAIDDLVKKAEHLINNCASELQNLLSNAATNLKPFPSVTFGVPKTLPTFTQYTKKLNLLRVY